MSNPLADMEKPDVIFAIGTNMTECHPVAATRLKRAVARGARMIVADPRRIPLADMAHLYLPLRVGTDVALLLGMAHVIVRDGLVDEGFVEARVTGADEFRAHVQKFTPEWASSICGVPAADIEKAAHWYGAATPGAIYYTLGITEHVTGVDNVKSLCNLALLTGNLGVEGGGINPMRGQNNIQGAGDAGAIPANFPGFQNTDNPEFVEKFTKLYGKQQSLGKGPTKVWALNECGKQIRAMLIDGENTVVSDPDRAHCQHALESLDHLVVIDLFRTETAELATVVFPATAWGETDGTQTNTERRIQRLRQAVPPQGQARPDWWIVGEIAKRAGYPGFDWGSAKDVFNELCDYSKVYKGIDWDLIDDARFQWPIPYKGHPGTPRLHEDGFLNGRGVLSAIEYRPPAEEVSADYPVWLTTGRRLEAYHTRTQTGRSSGIDYLLNEETLEVHPDDCAAWGFADGDMVRMASPRGEVEIKIEATDRSPRGTVFCSFSFNNVPVNFLTGSGYDPVTETAELKVCPVRLTRCN